MHSAVSLAYPVSEAYSGGTLEWLVQVFVPSVCFYRASVYVNKIILSFSRILTNMLSGLGSHPYSELELRCFFLGMHWSCLACSRDAFGELVVGACPVDLFRTLSITDLMSVENTYIQDSGHHVVWVSVLVDFHLIVACR